MVEKVLILSDTHFPLLDKKLWKATLNLIEDLQPDEIVHIGDLMDYPQPSRWTRGTREEFEGSVYEDSKACIKEYIEPLRSVYQGPIKVHEGNHDCLDSQTRAVTDQGLKYVSDLDGSERVMSVDDSGRTIWQSINKIVRYTHKGKMFRLNETSLSGLVTRNHRLVGLDNKKRGWTETTPESMETHRIFAFSAGRGNTTEHRISDLEIRLAAWCLTDSHYDEQYDKWVLYQSGEKADVPRELLKAVNLPYREVERNRNTDQIEGKVLKTKPQTSYEFHFKSDLVTALVPDKNKLPDWLWSLSERQVKLFIEELVFCDGTDYGRGTSKVLYVCREQLREELLILCSANGIRANATEYRPGHWRINLSDRVHTGVYRDSITEEDYDGEVWCLQVPNERFFVERDGKLHLTGNCRPRTYMEKYAPALAETDIFNFDKLLKFEDYGIELLPEFYDVAPGWITTHGHLGGIRLNQNAGITALNAAKRMGKSVVMGHTHRAGITHYTTGYNGLVDTLTGVEVGHVMNPKAVTYLKGATGNWQQSLGMLTLDGKHVTPSLIPVSGGKLTLDGKTYKI